MKMSAREAALNALLRVDKDKAYINAVMTDICDSSELNGLDRSFAYELAFGCVKNITLLDYIISQFSKTKIRKMSAPVKCILELGAYQILYTDKVPNSAACNESVKLAKKYAGRSAGFVNGVLRGLCRGIDNIKLPDKDGGDLCKYFSVMYSFPRWIVKRIYDDYGAEFCEVVLKCANETHKPYIRINRLYNYPHEEIISALQNDGIDATETKDVPNCYIVNGRLDINKSDTYKNGLFSVQNKSSQIASILTDPEPGEFIIDMCAAPGGKTTHLAELMDNRGEILAFDVYDHKIRLIENAAERLGINIIRAEKHDALIKRPELCGKADRVLVDAPCSGLGVMHTKPDIKWHRQEEDVNRLMYIQSKILDNAAEYVKPGGYLTYSTCTILKDENERQIERFMNRNGGFKLICEKKLFTHTDGGSGFYIAKLKKLKEFKNEQD